MPLKVPKAKRCRVCRETFQPRNSLQVACGLPCALEHQKRERIKTRKAADAARKRRLKTRSDWQREAQRAFNAYIRARDWGKPCIVHGESCPNASSGIQAGHFQGVGRRPELRFNAWNCHGQCATSNQGGHKWSRYSASVDALYERGLRERIGDERVDWLMGPHEPKQYREEELKRIKAIFQRRAKHYRRLRGIK